jgi:type II secretion system protein C
MFVSLLIRRTFWIVDIVVVVCAVLLGTSIYNKLTLVPELPAMEGTQDSPGDINRNMESVSTFKALDERAIFGEQTFNKQEKIEEPPPPPPQEEVKATKLNLKLKGTFPLMPRSLSTAVIEDVSKRKTDVYTEGDAITAAAILEEVFQRRVTILEGTGANQTRTYLSMDEPNLDSADTPPTSSRPVALPSAPAGTEIIPINRDDLLAKVQQDPAGFLGDTNVEPVMAGGKISGWKVTNVEGNEELEKLGVKDGDEFQDINGIRIDSYEKAIEVVQKFYNAREIRIKVMRGGAPHTIRYRVR